MSEFGFGLIEVMVAAVLLLVLSLVVASSLSGHNKSSSRLSSYSDCRDTAQMALDYFSSMGGKDTVLPPFFPDRPSTQPWAPLSPSDFFGTGYNSSPLFGSLQIRMISSWFPTATGTRILENDITTGAKLQLSALILNSTNLLQNLYNSQRATVCSGAGLSIINNFYPTPTPSGTLLPVQDILLRIEPFDLITNMVVLNCPADMIAAPKRGIQKPVPGFLQPTNNFATDGFQIVGNSDLGFRVSIKVMMRQRGDIPANSCNSEGVFVYGNDPVNSSSLNLKPASPSNIAGTINYGLIGTVWNSPTATDAKLSFLITNLEQGTTILCRDLNAIKRYKSCSEVTLTPVEGGSTISPSALRLSALGDLDFEFAALSPLNTYRMGIALVDSAGNSSPEYSIEFRSSAPPPPPPPPPPDHMCSCEDMVDRTPGATVNCPPHPTFTSFVRGNVDLIYDIWTNATCNAWTGSFRTGWGPLNQGAIIPGDVYGAPISAGTPCSPIPFSPGNYYSLTPHAQWERGLCIWLAPAGVSCASEGCGP